MISSISSDLKAGDEITIIWSEQPDQVSSDQPMTISLISLIKLDRLIVYFLNDQDD